MFAYSDDLTRRLGINSPSGDQLREMDYLLRAAYAYMQRYTGRKLEYAAVTRERHEIQTAAVLCLREWPVDSSQTIAIYEDDDTTAIDSANYTLLSKASGTFYRAGGWQGATYYYEISYTGGFQETDIEWPHLSMVQREIAAILWKRGGSQNMATDQYGVFDFTLAIADAELRSVVDVHLGQYRNIEIAQP